MANGGFPAVSSSDALGQDGSLTKTRQWGHIKQICLQRLNITAMRFYGQESGPSCSNRTIDFTTNNTALITYAQTGRGRWSSPRTWTNQTSHNATYLPAQMDDAFSNQGDYALTQHTFFRGGVAHWNIRQQWGRSSRWEVDDCLGSPCTYGTGYQCNTWHQVYVNAWEGACRPKLRITSAKLSESQCGAVANATDYPDAVLYTFSAKDVMSGEIVEGTCISANTSCLIGPELKAGTTYSVTVSAQLSDGEEVQGSNKLMLKTGVLHCR
jgi:hypothetical protein